MAALAALFVQEDLTMAEVQDIAHTIFCAV